MSVAVIEEVTLYDVRCPDCGGSPVQFYQRSMAERAADEHDATWHAPVFDDDPVMA